MILFAVAYTILFVFSFAAIIGIFHSIGEFDKDPGITLIVAMMLAFVWWLTWPAVIGVGIANKLKTNRKARLKV